MLLVNLWAIFVSYFGGILVAFGLYFVGIVITFYTQLYINNVFERKKVREEYFSNSIWWPLFLLGIFSDSCGSKIIGYIINIMDFCIFSWWFKFIKYTKRYKKYTNE